MKIITTFKKSVLTLVLVFLVQSIWAQPKWVRATYRDDPSTTISLGWSASAATVYYDTIDHGANYALYPMSRVTDRTTTHKGNSHYFTRLSNLKPGKVYYFVLKYGTSSSARYSFRTISDNPDDAISFISGGDSRKRLSFLGIGDPPCWMNGCRETRSDLNRIVARTRPDFVAFTGDYIRNYDIPFTANSEDDWRDWFDDWSYTVGPDGRITSVIHALGNHEDAADLDKLFDVPNVDVYYASNFGGNLFRLYTLNSEPADVCTDVIQKNWLINDLQQNSMPSNTPFWKIVQYHQPMVPHANYDPRTDLINCWSPNFKTYGVRLVCESHAHVMKTTYPLIYDATASPSYNGLVRDDTTGAVFIGDGSWGAPPRPLTTPSQTIPIPNVTQDVEQTSGFFFVNVNQNRIMIKAIVPFPDSIAGIPQLLDDDQGTELQAGVPLWRPANGSQCIIIPNYSPLLGYAKLQDQMTPSVVIAPNPAQNYVTVQFKKEFTEEVTIEVYDARGKLCQSHVNVRDKNFRLDVSNLCSGVNFINIVTKKDVESHKLIIAK